jgi:flagellar motor switch protein FliM
MEPNRLGPSPELFDSDNTAHDAMIDEGENFRVPTARGVLSAAEIAALLRPDIPEDAFAPEPEKVEARPVFDFENGGEGPLLTGDAQTLSAEMTVALRKHCGIDAVLGLLSASYSPMSEIVSLHSQPAVLVLFRDRVGLQNAGLTLDAGLASALVSVACGGAPVADTTRPLSALDGRILENMLAPLATAIDPSFQITCVETDRSAAFAMLPPGKAMLADLSCQLGPVSGRMIFARVQDNQLSADPLVAPPAITATVTARVARISVPISKLNNLKPGSVLRLGLPKDQPVELLSGGREGPVIAEGEIGRKGDRMALRISKSSPALKGMLPKA